MIDRVLSIPQSFEDALWAAARRELGADALAGAALRRAVIARSRRYTSDRELLAEPLTGLAAKLDLAARALFFTPADAPKAIVPVRELMRRGALAQRRPLRVLDVGAGVGAMSLGIAATVGIDAIFVTAIDRDAGALRLMASCFGELGIFVETSHGDVTSRDFGVGEIDVAVTGGMLNELSEDDAFRVVTRLLAAVGDHGALIVVEPALRDTSRALHRVRDRVIASGLASVFAPCTRASAPCPALADDRDWCHEDRAVSLCTKTAELARLTGLRDSGLKYSYLVLMSRSPGLVDLPARSQALRVVSQPRKTKGKLECFGCGDSGRRAVRLLGRSRSPDNRPFGRIRRGDVVVVPDTVESEIGRDDPVVVQSLADD